MRKYLLPIAVLTMTSSLMAQQSEEQQQPSVYRPLSGIQRSAPGTGGVSTGMLNTSFSFSQLLNTGAATSSGFDSSQAISGNISYAQYSTRTDLQFRYDGGALFYDQNSLANGTIQQRRNTSFHQLDFSDSYTFRRFSVLFGDAFHYTPDQYSLGGAIPGVGGLGSQFGGLAFNNPTILQSVSLFGRGTPSWTNSTFGQADYQITKRAVVDSTFAYGFSRLPDFPQFNGRQWSLSEGVDFRITPRTSLGLIYDHSHFQFDNVPVTTNVDVGRVSVAHLFSRSLSASASIGPQGINSTGAPARTTFYADGRLAYLRGKVTYDAYYTRYTTSGGFSLLGYVQDQFGVGYNRMMSRTFTLRLSGAYLHDSANGLTQQRLPQFSTIDGEQFGIQADKKLGRYVGAYASYTFRYQSTNTNVKPQVLYAGSNHTLGFGLTYSPRGWRVKR